MNLDENIWERLRAPQRALVVSFPFRRDDYNTVDTVYGYRVQHVLTMGPTKGGIRFDDDVNLGEVTALAIWMSWKCALIGLPSEEPRAVCGSTRPRSAARSSSASRAATRWRSSR